MQNTVRFQDDPLQPFDHDRIPFPLNGFPGFPSTRMAGSSMFAIVHHENDEMEMVG